MKAVAQTNSIINATGDKVAILKTWYNHKQCVFAEDQEVAELTPDTWFSVTDGDKIILVRTKALQIL